MQRPELKIPPLAKWLTSPSICVIIEIGINRADQNMGGALLEFPMRSGMHGKPRVSPAISVCDNLQNFKIGFSTEAVAQ